MTLTSDRLIWPGATLVAILGLTAYCQAHGWVDAVETPLLLSLRWGTLAGTAGVASLALAWHQRALLVDLASRSFAVRLAMGLAFAVAVLLIGAVIHALSAPVPDLSIRVARHMFDLLPLAGALGALAAAGLSIAIHLRPAPGRTSWISLPEEPRLRLRPEEVQFVRSAGNYCDFVANGRSHLVRVPLKVIAERLQVAGFVQIHRTIIVNSQRVRTVSEDSGGRLCAYLDSGAAVPVSRGFRRSLDDLI